jgi:hypothetical protein
MFSFPRGARHVPGLLVCLELDCGSLCFFAVALSFGVCRVAKHSHDHLGRRSRLGQHAAGRFVQRMMLAIERQPSLRDRILHKSAETINAEWLAVSGRNDHDVHVVGVKRGDGVDAAVSVALARSSAALSQSSCLA